MTSPRGLEARGWHRRQPPADFSPASGRCSRINSRAGLLIESDFRSGAGPALGPVPPCRGRRVVRRRTRDHCHAKSLFRPGAEAAASRRSDRECPSSYDCSIRVLVERRQLRYRCRRPPPAGRCRCHFSVHRRLPCSAPELLNEVEIAGGVEDVLFGPPLRRRPLCRCMGRSPESGPISGGRRCRRADVAVHQSLQFQVNPRAVWRREYSTIS